MLAALLPERVIVRGAFASRFSLLANVSEKIILSFCWRTGRARFFEKAGGGSNDFT